MYHLNRCMKLTDYEVLREGNKSQCPICNEWFSFRGLPSHFHKAHNPHAKMPSHSAPAWNKGKTKETDLRVKLNAEKISIATKGKGKPPLTEAQKKKVSEGMKKAHAEGRAHNIGSSRWNNEPSYPEKFFMKVIENEFEDKNYVRELPFRRFSLDFAWVEKRKCIEIDGEQHERFADYKARDERKDAALKAEGWQVLRISWKEMFNNPKYWIKVAKEFI